MSNNIFYLKIGLPWQNLTLYQFPVIFHSLKEFFKNQINELGSKICRWCAQDLNPRPHMKGANNSTDP